jgi:putative nucleotidyltransferase with HDIG domain
MISADRISASVETLPALPLAVTEVIRLSSSPDTSLTDLERVVKPDPSLTANILRMANSARYHAMNRIVTVKDAIQRVGTRGLFEIATGHAFVRVIPQFLPGYGIDATRFWTHSVAVAVFAQKVLKRSPAEAEVAFTAGLLHDLGKLVIGAFLEEKAAEVRELLNGKTETPLSFINAEREFLGTDHAEVGLAIARKWRLPDYVADAARWHHSPREAKVGSARRIATAVHVANCLAHSLGYGADLGELHRTLDPFAMDDLEVRMSDLERIASDSLKEISELTQSLQANEKEAK